MVSSIRLGLEVGDDRLYSHHNCCKVGARYRNDGSTAGTVDQDVNGLTV